MSTTTQTPASSSDPTQGEEHRTTTRRESVGTFLSPKNIGAIYVWVVIIALFCIIASDTFPTTTTAKSILNQYSVTGIVALSLVVPLAAAYYDLSIGFTVGLSGVLVATLLDSTSWSPVLCVLVTIAACVLIGLLNGFVVIGLGVDSFIGTLGSGAIIGAITIGVSGNLTVTGRVGEGYTKLANTQFLGLTLPVYYMLVIMLVIGYLLERTQIGRHFYAMGFDRETARLTGIAVNRLGIMAFVTSAVIAGFAGMVLAARVASGSPEAGPSYLIPAFSAAFLGATQLRAGRFNPWGTVIAVLLLGTGAVGLLLAGGPTWTPQLFEGTVLIVAVALTGFGQNAIRSRLAVLRARRGRGATPAAQPAARADPPNHEVAPP